MKIEIINKNVTLSGMNSPRQIINTPKMAGFTYSNDIY